MALFTVICLLHESAHAYLGDIQWTNAPTSALIKCVEVGHAGAQFEYAKRLINQDSTETNLIINLLSSAARTLPDAHGTLAGLYWWGYGAHRNGPTCTHRNGPI